MLKGGKLLVGCVVGLIGIIVSFVVVFTVFVEIARQQLPFGKGQVADWMMGTPQPVARELQDNGYVNAGVGVGWKDFVHAEDHSPPSGIPFPYKPHLNCLFQDPNYTRHTGVDFRENTGSPVVATMSGLVVWAAPNGNWGKLVIVENNGYQTYFAHLSSIEVVKGQVISRDQLVGKVGNTGNSSGPHLHYGIKKRVGDKGAAWVNPLGYFDGADYKKVPCPRTN